MATILTAECLAGHNDPSGKPPYIRSSPAWQAFRAGQEIAGMSAPKKCTQARGYAVRIVTVAGSIVLVRFNGKDLSDVTVVREAQPIDAEVLLTTTVYTLAIENKHGTTVRVFRSEEGASAALAAWARQWWPKEGAWLDGAIDAEAFNALPDGEAISMYFHAVDSHEWYSLDSATLEA